MTDDEIARAADVRFGRIVQPAFPGAHWFGESRQR